MLLAGVSRKGGARKRECRAFVFEDAKSGAGVIDNQLINTSAVHGPERWLREK